MKFNTGTKSGINVSDSRHSLAYPAQQDNEKVQSFTFNAAKTLHMTAEKLVIATSFTSLGKDQLHRVPPNKYLDVLFTGDKT